MSNGELAAKMSVHPGQVTRWTQKRTAGIQIATAIKLAEILQLNVEDIDW